MDGVTPAQGFGRLGCPEYHTAVVGITCGPFLVSINLLKLNKMDIRKISYALLFLLLSQDRPSAPVMPSHGGNVCSLPRDEGPCDTWMVRFYYDSGTGKCTEFWYGSCQGNANNFASMEACQRECGGVVRESAPSPRRVTPRRGPPMGARRARA